MDIVYASWVIRLCGNGRIQCIMGPGAAVPTRNDYPTSSEVVRITGRTPEQLCEVAGLEPHPCYAKQHKNGV